MRRSVGVRGVAIFGALAFLACLAPGVASAESLLRVVVRGDGTGQVTASGGGIDCGSVCEASYPAGEVTLEAVPSLGSHFVAWSGECYAFGGSACTLTMDGDKEVSAWFARDTRTLSVQISGDGSGRITSNPSGIDCGPTCGFSFPADVSEVTLSVVPEAGTTFLGWSGGCSGSSRSCVVDLSGSRNVGVTLSQSTSRLQVLRGNGIGSVSGDVRSEPAGIDCGVDCDEVYPQGTRVTLSAFPRAVIPGGPENLDFLWEGPCEETAGRACIVDMNGPQVTVEAWFFETPEGAGMETVTVRTTGGGRGRVTSDPAGIDCRSECVGSFRTMSMLTLRAAPDTDSVLASWSISGTADFVGNEVRFAVDGPREAVARFELRAQPVTITKIGDGGGRVVSVPAGIDCGADCQGSFRVGTTVTLTATPDAGSVLVGWSVSGSGMDIPGPNQVRFTVSEARQVLARFEPLNWTVTVTKEGAGSGRVVSAPAGIDCGADCEGSFPAGTTVTLTATPDAGSFFVGWGVTGNADFPGPRQVRFTVSEARQVTARFEPLNWMVTVTKEGDGSGRVVSVPPGIECGADCAGSFSAGTTVTLTATPDAGSRFVGWAVTGSGVDNPGPRQVRFTVREARQVSARFDRDSYSLAVTKTGAGSGSVTSNPPGISCGSDCSEWYSLNVTVTLTASAGSGSRFMGWGGACSGTGTCAVTMDGSKFVTADFEPAPYTLSVSKTGTGAGSVTSVPSGINCGVDCSENYPSSATVLLTASASPGSAFRGWSGGGCSGTGTCSVTVDSSKTVVATFERDRYSLAVVKTGSGSGVVSSSPPGISCGSDCSEWYPIGATVSLSAAPSSGSVFTGWSGGCSGTGACTLTMDASKNVSANFSPASHLLTVSRTGTGSGTVSSSPGGIYCGSDCWQYYSNGTTVTLNPSADAGSVFIGWSGACSGSGGCQVTMTSARSVIANFAYVTRLLSVSKSGTGQGTVSSSPGGIYCGSDCGEYYPNGTTVSLFASPSSGSFFAGWTGACSGTGSCTVSMTGARSVTAVFDRQSFLLTVTRQGGGGSVSSNPAGISCGSDCGQWYWSGTTVTLFATGGSGYRFTGWGGACSGTGPTCTLTMNGSRNVTATFIYAP